MAVARRDNVAQRADHVQPQRAQAEMIVLAVKYFVKPGNTEAVVAALRRMKPLVTAHEPNCRMYQLSRAENADNLLFLYEVYDDQAALDFHRATPHFKSIIEGEVIPMLERREREHYRVEIP
jgi:(4S)-4-hydroxy-5-phosphonooxypentane-2,3-dione isomerase